MNFDPILPMTKQKPTSDEDFYNDVESQGVGLQVTPTNPGVTTSTTNFMEEEIVASINPLPSSSQSSPTSSRFRSRMDLPGAYGVLPDGAIDSYQPPSRQEVVQPEESTDSTDLSIDGLAVANLVVDHDQEDQSDLPAAVPADTTTDKSIAKARRKQQTKQLKRYIVVAVTILCVAFVLFLVSFLISRTKTRPASEDNFNPTQTYNSSIMPTQSPTSLRETILSLLPLESSKKILEDLDSPQAMAFEWLMEDVRSGVSRSLLDQDPKHGRIVQRFALATLFFSTNGPGWTANDYWLDHNINECHWYKGPSFSDRDKRSTFIPGYLTEFANLSGTPSCHDDGDNLGTQSFYKHLWLDQNNLEGKLPEELFLLTTLETLSITRNPLGGTISTRVGQLTALRGLLLNHISDAHQIPSEIGLLTNLIGLGLNHNQHNGLVPNQLWQGLTNLQTLFLSSNPDLTGSIPPEIGAMTNMRFLALGRSQFFGTIPSQVGQLRHLELFALHKNQVSGTIPSELSNLLRLDYLALYGNYLSGELPTELGVVTTLTHFALSDNHLSGSIPSEFGRLTNLTTCLDLQNNPLLTGTVPTQLGLLTSLRELELHNNGLTGPLPKEIGGLTSMGKLNLANNSLSGIVPPELAHLRPTLHTLRLEGNPQLSGRLPDPICNLTATCKDYSWLRCQEPFGISFDCTQILCGCECPC